jgi:hypothetical protein
MTAISFPTTFVLPDPRPARGKHRTRRHLAGAAAGAFAAWRAARVEFAVGAASVGAVLAAVLS